ncbi:Protein tramtrack, beta isoform, partial [Pseudolycoriella hygida]
MQQDTSFVQYCFSNDVRSPEFKVIKMSVQQFCLRWNNHQPNFISVFSALLHNEALVDVTLAAEGRHLQAHKVVLSACSSYFQSLFTSNPCQHPIVILKDVQYNDLKTMVDFMYYGEVNVSQEQLPHILKTAEMLKIKGLAEMPDPVTLTKSENKSSDQTDSVAPNSVHESMWGSGSASTERTSEEHSSIEGSSGLNMSQTQMDQMTAFGPAPTNLSSQHNLANPKMMKESLSTEDIPQHDSSQESIDEVHHGHHHIHQTIIKTDTDLSGMPQQMPIDITSPTTPSDHGSNVSCPQSQPSHSGVQWTVVDSNYPRFALSSCQTNVAGMSSGGNHNNPNESQHSTSNTSANSATSSNHAQLHNYQGPSYSPQIISKGTKQQFLTMGTKRGRLLIRQPRVKRDSDTLNQSPETEYDHVAFSHRLL